MKPRAILGAISLLALSCLRPTEERVERDREVGQATGYGLTVSVEDGLAAVRSLSTPLITLWGSAPSFRFTVSSLGTRELFVDVQNCLPDAELQVVSGRALITPLDNVDADIPTRKRWQVDVNDGDTQLALAPQDSASAEPFRFALLSDIQEAIDKVSDIYDRINDEDGIRFVLGAGDLTSGGTREQLERFQKELLRLKVPYFATLGNHELGTRPDLFHDYFGRGNFHFRFHDVAFTLLDDGSASLDPTVYEWLDGWLEASRHDVHIVAMHIPPLDPFGVRNGAWASRAEAAKFLGRLAEGHVDLTLYGHIHSYYAFDNAGIPAFISGGGGAIPERFDGIGRHFMVFTADPQSGITAHDVVRVD